MLHLIPSRYPPAIMCVKRAAILEACFSRDVTWFKGQRENQGFPQVLLETFVRMNSTHENKSDRDLPLLKPPFYPCTCNGDSTKPGLSSDSARVLSAGGQALSPVACKAFLRGDVFTSSSGTLNRSMPMPTCISNGIDGVRS